MTGGPAGNRIEPLPKHEREEEINAVALELYKVQFQPYTGGRYEFMSGTLLHKLQAEGRLEECHLRAADLVLKDLERASGKSGSVTMGWRDKIDNSLVSCLPESVWTNDAYDRIKLLMDEALTRKERFLFVDLFVNDYFKKWKGELLIEMGWLLSGYRGRDQARSAGVARVQALLERIDAYYLGEQGYACRGLTQNGIRAKMLRPAYAGG
ncbi:MAG TPA: hypothetical protein VE986_08605 [Hyphomicrobiales bacterium]|nr:hypothetical protein [Hyphomicrobiales bacterium]